jgi:hypothetical protein
MTKLASPSLKTKNLPFLSCLFLWSLGLYLCALGAVPLSTKSATTFTSLQATAKWSALGLPLLLMLVSGLVSSSQKEVITFWRLKNRLPACRAFSTLARLDNRVDLKVLESIALPWPKHPNDQNRMWYKFYSAIKDHPVVLHSHRLYLLGREAAVISFLFAVVAPASLIAFTGWGPVTLLCTGILAIQYFLCAVAAQNYASRFVCNVLAIATSRPQQEAGPYGSPAGSPSGQP